MDNVVTKILKKILNESDELDWIRDINPLDEPGTFFEDKDLEDYLTITDEDIIFEIPFEEWEEEVDLSEDDKWYLKDLIYHGQGWYDANDYYEFDYDEFNYAGYQLDAQQKYRFQTILNEIGSGVNINDYISGNKFNDIEDELKYPQLKSYFSDLQDAYLSIVGYAIQRNRWLSLGNEYQAILNKTGIELQLDYSDNLSIFIPIEKALNLYGENRLESLTDLMNIVSKPIAEGYWYDSFYEEWDTSGSDDDINYEIDKFLEKSEEFIEEEVDTMYSWDEIIKKFEKLGFKPSKRNGWRDYFELVDNKNNQTYMVTPNDDMVNLFIFNHTRNYLSRWDSDEFKQFKIPLDQLPQYVTNYRLNLESFKLK